MASIGSLLFYTGQIGFVWFAVSLLDAMNRDQFIDRRLKIVMRAFIIVVLVFVGKIYYRN